MGEYVGWTEDRIEALKALWLDGYSASQIAAEMGDLSRNAVIGKVNRLGVLRSNKTARAPRTRSEEKRRREERNHQLAVIRRRRREEIRAVLVAIVASDPIPEPVAVAMPSAPITMTNLEPAHCRWPINDPRAADFHFCGRPRTSGAYCEGHYALAHRSVENRKRDTPPFLPYRVGQAA
jgi:GcrA cell cycle regulator